jgi:hypothetical protein
MSAQADPQAGNPQASRVMQRLKGSLSQSSHQMLLPTDPTDQPVPDPAAFQPAISDQPQDATQLTESSPLQEIAQETAQEPMDPFAAAVPTAVEEVAQVQDLNPEYPVGGSAKEVSPIHVTVEHPAVDLAPGVQYVETEKSHELPPEVEGFLQTVEDHQDQIPQEIVLANPQTGQALPRVMAQPVVILPMTQKIEDAGKSKSTTYSVRWLIEWSWKMMKVFSGKVIYREEAAA